MMELYRENRIRTAALYVDILKIRNGERQFRCPSFQIEKQPKLADSTTCW